MAGNPDIEEGKHYCPACKNRTEWAGKKIQRCQGCSRRFPCGNVRCKHQDCESHRVVWGASPPEPLETTDVADPDDLFSYLGS